MMFVQKNCMFNLDKIDYRPLRRQLEKDVNGASEILNYDILASLMDCIVSNLGGISTMDQNKSQQVLLSHMSIHDYY